MLVAFYTQSESKLQSSDKQLEKRGLSARFRTGIISATVAAQLPCVSIASLMVENNILIEKRCAFYQIQWNGRIHENILLRRTW